MSLEINEMLGGFLRLAMEKLHSLELARRPTGSQEASRSDDETVREDKDGRP